MLCHFVAACQMNKRILGPFKGAHHNEVCQALPTFEGVLIITCLALQAALVRCWLTRHVS